MEHAMSSDDRRLLAIARETLHYSVGEVIKPLISCPMLVGVLCKSLIKFGLCYCDNSILYNNRKGPGRLTYIQGMQVVKISSSSII